MKKRLLGQTQIAVSEIGLGTVKLGRNQGLKYPQNFLLPSDAEVDALLHCAKELGINLLDTAPAYGHSEARLGAWLRGQRHEWIISSKVGEQFIEGKSFFDFSPSALARSLDQSLKALQTDYLDILLIHSDGNDLYHIEEEGVLNTLAQFKQSGKIRSFGMSTKNTAGGLRTLELAEVAMVSFSPAYLEEREVLKYAATHNKGILIKKALVSGHLPLQEISKTLNFILAEPGVTSIIIGTINPQHLRDNLKELD